MVPKYVGYDPVVRRFHEAEVLRELRHKLEDAKREVIAAQSRVDEQRRLIQELAAKVPVELGGTKT